jgi:hypothetical protein
LLKFTRLIDVVLREPNTESLSKIFRLKTDLVEFPAIGTGRHVDEIGQARRDARVHRRPNPVWWDVIPVRVRQKSFEHLWLH